MGTNFARLEDTPYGQVLAIIERGEGREGQEGPVLIIRISEVGGMEPSYQIGPLKDTDDGWDAMQLQLEKLDMQKAAKSLYDAAVKIMGE